jgi:hypothetical protein
MKSPPICQASGTLPRAGKRHPQTPHPNDIYQTSCPIEANAPSGVKRMWKKQDDVGGEQPELPSKERSNAAKLLSDALGQSSSINNDSEKRNVPAASEKGLAADSNQSPPSPTMNTYRDAVKEFTTNATAFIEQLPLLAKAREAYDRAMRASSEMRKVLDTSDQNLRTLMTQLEQKTDLQEFKSATDKKPPEPAKVERMKGIGEGESRPYRWP